MKKTILCSLALVLVLPLAACGQTQADGTQAPAVTEIAAISGSPAPALTTAPAVPPTDAPTEPAQALTLTGILTEILNDYHPATAGCSLTSARMAGELLDWNAAEKPEAAAITAETQTFFQALNADQAAAFPELLQGIYDAAGALLGENAKDLLDSAGYAPQAFPWTPGDVISVFDAVYQGVGMTRPVD